MRAQQAAAHGRRGAVEHPKQRAALVACAQRLGQLKIAAGRLPDRHELLTCVAAQRHQTADALHLCFRQVFDHGAERAHGKALFERLQLRQHGAVELAEDIFLVQFDDMVIFIQLMQVGPKLLLAEGRQLAVGVGAGVDEHLGRLEAGQLSQQRGPALALCHLHLPCRYVGKADAELTVEQKDGGKIIVPALRQHIGIGDGAGRDDADDLAADDALGRGRVLHLLADGDAVALFDEAGDVAVSAVKRHAAHGRALRQTAHLAGERQIELARNGKRVVKEHLIEIAETVEQDLVLAGPFDGEILLHHRGQLAFVHAFIRSSQRASCSPCGRYVPSQSR